MELMSNNLGNGDPKPFVKLPKEKLLMCLTCPLCHNLFSEATTVSECLHTFCRECIYNKIGDEKLHCCPVCNIHLGTAPFDKLRFDYSLQALRTKLFPPEPPVPLELNHEEISLSSPVVNPPEYSAQRNISARTKYPTRKILDLLSHDDDSKIPEYCLKSFSSEKIPSNEVPIHENQKILNATSNESPKREVLNNDAETNISDDPLNPVNQVADTNHKVKIQFRRRGKKPGVQNDENGSIMASQSETVTHTKPKRGRKRKNVMVQNTGDRNGESSKRFNQVWFSLIASNSQEGDEPLPQIPSCYLRVNDSNATVSVVKKYVATKLDLASDQEVEIRLRGQPLTSTQQLHNLVDLWIRTSPASELINPTAGSSGKDIMMVLSYSQKACP